MSSYDDDIQKIISMLKTLKRKINEFMKIRAHDFFNEPLSSNSYDYSLLSDGWISNQEHFSELITYLEKRKPTKKLKDGGLTGKELSLKLHVVEQALQELELQEENFQSFTPEGRSKGFKIWHQLNKLKNFWQQYLDHINTILGTLGVIGIPGSDAINEFVMLLEKLLKWWNKRKK